MGAREEDIDREISKEGTENGKARVQSVPNCTSRMIMCARVFLSANLGYIKIVIESIPKANQFISVREIRVGLISG